jgi:hypothetical protein
MSDFDTCCCGANEAMCVDCLKDQHRRCQIRREQSMTVEQRVARLEEHEWERQWLALPEHRQIAARVALRRRRT